MKKALLIIDVQNDFCENGALAVPNANSIIPYINNLSQSNTFDEIILSQDFHPKDHVSFAANHPTQKVGDSVVLGDNTSQILWPIHCVQGTFGTKFHETLNQSTVTKIIQKGTNKFIDSYSAFYDNNHKVATGLTTYLKSKEITHVEIVGLALDYCVKFSALDAIHEGFKTSIHYKGTKAVNLQSNDYKEAIIQLIEKGVHIIA